ncbi:MAG TPA: response regulator [Candidatus Acidoferrum sp.]|nr:response regulator [Candidatus Acidoferrum sp.]
MRILLAEDNAVNQKLAMRLLEKMGHSVSVAANGKEALHQFASANFDLILMDIQMPEMGGLEATDAIRGSEQGTGKHLPIVAMTAHAMKGDREKCLAAGMDGYVSKPVRLDLLREEIARVCSLPGFSGTNSEATMESIQAKAGINRAELLARVENDEALAREILTIFQDEVAGNRNELQAAVEKKSPSETQKAAHAFKGMLANLAAAHASSLAADLELLASSGQCEAFEPAWRAFEAELRLVQSDAEQLLSGAAK